MKRFAGSYASATCLTCGDAPADPGQGRWTGPNAMAVGKQHAVRHGHEVSYWQEVTGKWDCSMDGPRIAPRRRRPSAKEGRA